MSTGWILIGMGAVGATVEFLIGLHYSRITPERLTGRFKADGVTPEHVHMLGRAMMYAAPFIFLLFAVFGLGWIGDFEPATFN